MSEFVAEEGRIDDALRLLCEVFRYDLSGMSNDFRMESLYIFAKYFFPYEKTMVKMAPGITERIQKYANTLVLDRNQLHEFMIDEMKKYSLQFQLFSPEECADIVLAECEKDTESLEKCISRQRNDSEKGITANLRNS